jgi:hypothetical protein
VNSYAVFSGDIEGEGNEHFILESVRVRLQLFNFINSVIRFRK